jgi:phytoene dehydrogenase-like protein
MDTDATIEALQAELEAFKARDPQGYAEFLKELQEKTDAFNTLLEEASKEN